MTRAALAALLLLLPAPTAMASPFGTLFAGSPPSTLGVAAEGALAPCPGPPNCVASRATDAGHAIAPFALGGNADEGWRRLVAAIRATPGATVVTDERRGGARYLHAEFASRVMGFVDDLECLLPERATSIEVRSSARVGRSDFGVNRARVEALRAALAEPAR